MDYRDLFERAVWTAVEAFLGVLVVTDLSSWEAAAAAGAGAAISVVKTAAQHRLRG